MRRIIFDTLWVVGASIGLAFSSFVLWLIVRTSPHSAEFYLKPYWEQQLNDIATVVAFSAMPVLFCVCWRFLYQSLIAYDKKEHLQ
jgi:hypothetical protein